MVYKPTNITGGPHPVTESGHPKKAAAAQVAAAQGVPQISFSATSAALSNKASYPFFLRTLPPASWSLCNFMIFDGNGHHEWHEWWVAYRRNRGTKLRLFR